MNLLYDESAVFLSLEYALEVLKAMEDYLFVCWKSLVTLDLPPFADPLKKCRTIADLNPDYTRQCLIALKALIAQSKKGPEDLQGDNKNHRYVYFN